VCHDHPLGQHGGASLPRAPTPLVMRSQRANTLR
jgi:hypothetical protein